MHPRPVQGETFRVHAVRTELIFYCLSKDVFSMSGFLGQDNGVIKLDAVTQVYAALGNG
jgi:hypothetical protein